MNITTNGFFWIDTHVYIIRSKERDLCPFVNVYSLCAWMYLYYISVFVYEHFYQGILKHLT